jgi:hypothetical protein
VFQVGSFDEKNQSPKISCYCPFKGANLPMSIGAKKINRREESGKYLRKKGTIKKEN